MRHRLPLSSLLLIVACLVAPGAAAPAAEMRVDSEASTLVVKVFRAGVARALAHDHVVRAGRFAGTVRFDPRHPEASAVALEVEAASLVADEPALRRAHGLAGELSEKDRGEVQETMLGPGQLDTGRYPTIRFRSTEVRPLGGGRYELGGELTLRGQTRPLRFPVTVVEEGDTLRAKGSVRFAQSAFGIRPFRAALGAVSNRDEVELVFELLARR